MYDAHACLFCSNLKAVSWQAYPSWVYIRGKWCGKHTVGCNWKNTRAQYKSITKTMSRHWQIINDVYIYILFVYIYIYIYLCRRNLAFAHKNKNGVASFWLISMGSPQNKRMRMPMSLLHSKLSLDRLCSHKTKAKRPAFLKDPALQADLTTEATNLAGTTAARLDLCPIGPTYVLLENLSIYVWFISWT